ncbi:MAG: phage terminase large subunit [Candidatus Hinthialibacter antarcticus]|nr:phage terminase large subunit [Candidatus Hinthialibacter antarcticus]
MMKDETPSIEPQDAQRHLHDLEEEMERVKHCLDEESDLLDSKVQGLHRLFLSYISGYFSAAAKLLPGRSKPEPTPPEEPLESKINRWKSDVVLFAKEALDIELFDHQKQLCQSEKRTVMLIAGRGAGKTQASMVAALFHALQENQIVLVVSSSQRMSSEFGSRLIFLISGSPIKEFAASMSSRAIELNNGSSIKFLPANPATIRGYHPKKGGTGGVTIILDEACFMENGKQVRKAVEYALITTSKKNGKLYIVSSPSSAASWVYGYVQNAKGAKSDIEVIQCASSANPLISSKELDRLRQNKNELEFRAEVLGEWVEGACGLFKGLIEPNRQPRFALPPQAVYALGADLALSFSPNHDRSVLAVVAQYQTGFDLEPKYAIVDLKVFETASDRDLRESAQALIETYNIECAAVEQYQGKSLAEYCASQNVEVELVAPSVQRQQIAFHAMHALLKQKRLALPDDLDPAFFEELKAFEYRRGPHGGAQFGHPLSGGMHDDTVYAVAWALDALRNRAASEGGNASAEVGVVIDFLPGA